MELPALEEIERTLLQLKGVEAARVCAEGDQITEIHVVASQGMRPKNIARDVRSYMVAALGIDIPHQRISVAVTGPEAEVERDDGAQSQGQAPPEEKAIAAQRVRFRSVNVLVEGVHSEAQVTLDVGGRILIGVSEGAPAMLGTERLIAAATLAALGKLVREDVRLVPGDLSVARCGSGDAVLVEIIIVHPRAEQRLVGACRVQQDRHRCVVFAVLDALNRVLETLVPQAWVAFNVSS